MKNPNGLLFDSPSSLWLLSLVMLASSCGGGTGVGNPLSPTPEDSSASGAAAGAVGGALSGASSTGTITAFFKKKPSFSFISNAWASASCPTYQSAQGAGCNASGGSMWLSYVDCSFDGSEASFDGVLSFIMSFGTASCGTFPAPVENGNLIRQYVQSSGSTVPSSGAITTSYGSLTTIDNHTSNLGNFDGDAITSLVNGGYGSKVGFGSSGLKTSVAVEQRIITVGVLDHSISGNLAVSETNSIQTLTGSVQVYHNLLKVVGTAVFNNVVHYNDCCLPRSGSITTTFSAGSNVSPSAAGELAVGKSEVLTFTGCKTATLQSYDGTTVDVALTRCF